ncbi:MAG TPA: ABC transporter permease [Trebonia sp.]|nr:ABC transporter permease [Trebonia sp.]
MTRYLIKRLAGVIVLAFGISVVVFLIIRLVPGNPAISILGTNAGNPALVARLENQLGLNQPITTQYVKWIGGVLQANFGYSYDQQLPVATLIADNLGPTLELTLFALVLTVVFGLILGVTAALKRNSAYDTVSMGTALTFLSLPSFWLGLVLLVIFAVQLHWFAVVGGSGFKGLVLPAVTLALGGIGFTARFVRSSVIEALRQQHVVTSRAKGLSRSAVLVKHVIRNSLLPVFTIVGLQTGNLLSGAVIIETVFSRPGLGRLLVNAILAKDYETVQAVVLVIALMYALVNFVVDILYPVLDPRIAYR